jgi:hypothetical protein
MEAVSATTRNVMMMMMADRTYNSNGDTNNHEDLVELMCTKFCLRFMICKSLIANKYVCNDAHKKFEYI